MTPSNRLNWSLLLLCLAASAATAADAPSPTGSQESGLVIHIGLPDAIDASARDEALILLVFGKPRASAINRLDLEVLQSPEFAKVAGRLHLVLADVDVDEKPAQLFKVTQVPDLILMTAEQKIIARTAGFMSLEQLQEWIAAGRRLAAAGQWAGAATTAAPVPEMMNEKGLRETVRLLGLANPADRTHFETDLLAQGKTAVPPLLDGLSAAYLGERLGAAEALRKLLPDTAPQVDPWAAQADRGKQLAALRQWWAAHQEVSPPRPSDDADQPVQRSIKMAVESILSDDPLRRTAGMSALVLVGSPALPSVRQALERTVAAGDQMAIRVLEDVRWAILVPDALEAQVHVRRDLARGRSAQRQAATRRLAAGKQAALPALRELVNDPDPLIKESTVAALKAVGGTEALAATAVLLSARDANLRMIAAQTLGQSKNPAAAKHLDLAVGDTDEVVACAALAALEEVEAKDQKNVLVKCLADPRSRVRAAAIEVIGKLKVNGAAKNVDKLLDDPDPFVVKTALDALEHLGANPETPRLLAVIKRLPDLTGQAVHLIVESKSPNLPQTISTIYDQSTDERRGAILDVLTAKYQRETNDAAWEPFLKNVAGSAKAEIRRKLVGVLNHQSYELSSRFVAPLLEDKDPQVRLATAELILGLAAYHWGAESNEMGQPDNGVLINIYVIPVSPARTTRKAEPKNAAAQAERAKQIRQMYDLWHAALGKQLGEKPDPIVALAFYVTGDGRSGLESLGQALSSLDLEPKLKSRDIDKTIVLVMHLLPWPESRELVARAVQRPELFVLMLASMKQAPKELQEFISQPEPVVAAVESAKGSKYEQFVQLLLEHDSDTPQALTMTSSGGRTIAGLLAKSKSPQARALGFFALGQSADKKELPAVIQEALKDENPWVRCVGVQTIWNTNKNQYEKEKILGPLLSDFSPRVAALAALALLTDGLLTEINGQSELTHFHYENASVWVGFSYTYHQDNPVEVIDRKPAFLEAARRRWAQATDEQVGDSVDPYALLLAQYGDAGPLEAELEIWKTNKNETLTSTLLAGALLTHDPRFLPVIKEHVDQATQRYELQSLLKRLRGMTGDEARQLRRDINRRINAAKE